MVMYNKLIIYDMRRRDIKVRIMTLYYRYIIRSLYNFIKYGGGMRCRDIRARIVVLCISMILI